MSERHRAALASAAVWIALIAAGIALVVPATGGFDLRLSALRLSAHDSFRPGGVGLVALVVAAIAVGPAAARRRLSATAAAIVDAVDRLPFRWLVAALAVT